MQIVSKILAAFAMLGAGLSAIFYVLFKQAREERKVINDKYDDMSKNVDALADADKAANEVRKENEELVEKAHSGNSLDAFNACNDLLSK